MPQFGGGNSYGLPMAPPQIQQTLTYTPQQPQRQPPQQFYGQQQPSLPQTPQPSYGGYDPNSIQGLLNRVQQGPSQQQAPTVYGGTPQPNQGHNSDLSRLLASVSGGGPAAQNAYGVLQQHQQQGNLPPNIATLLGNLNQQRPPQPSTPSYGQQYQPQPPPQQQYQPQQHQQHQQQQPPADMSSIMAGLARWKG